jgi:flagellar biosynthesis activator protein FlaF
MNPYSNAAHAANIPQEGNPRETEAWALTEAARRMAAASRGEAEDMREALRLNWKLWTIFQADLIGKVEAGETTETIVNMLSLCQFVDFHTVGALTEPTAPKIEVLVNINRNIASGLRDSLAREAREAAVADGDAAQQPAQAAPAAPANPYGQPAAPATHTPISATA